MTIEELPARASVLEWRCDPASGCDDPRLSRDLGRRIVLVCDEGYQSSLAAMTLQKPGFAWATDLVGGFQAWAAAGLPVLREVRGPGQVQPLRSVPPVADGAAAV